MTKKVDTPKPHSIIDISEIAREHGINVPTFASAEFLLHRSREDLEDALRLVKVDPVMLSDSPYRIHLSISSWRADGTPRGTLATRERVGGVWTITLFLWSQRVRES